MTNPAMVLQKLQLTLKSQGLLYNYLHKALFSCTGLAKTVCRPLFNPLNLLPENKN